MKKIVIIGNSAAGLSALENFRKHDQESQVTVISKEGKLLYKRRKETIERSFADSKQNHGYRYARYRGKAKVQSYAWLSCCVQNMKTIALREV